MTTLGIRYEDWRLRPHGTPAAYRRHLRHGERPCESCRQAEALRWAEWASRNDREETRRQRYAQARAAGLNPRAAKLARSARRAAA